MALFTGGYALEEATPFSTAPILSALSGTDARVIDLAISAANALSVRGQRWLTRRRAAYSLCFADAGVSSSSPSATEYSLASQPTMLHTACSGAVCSLACIMLASGSRLPGCTMAVLTALSATKTDPGAVFHTGSTSKIREKMPSSLCSISNECLIRFRVAVSTDIASASRWYSSRLCCTMGLRSRSLVVR